MFLMTGKAPHPGVTYVARERWEGKEEFPGHPLSVRRNDLRIEMLLALLVLPKKLSGWWYMYPLELCSQQTYLP